MAMKLVQLLFALLPLLVGASASPTTADWNALNATVGGRLHATLPFELPCFSTFNGQSVAANLSACATIQQNYTQAEFRLQHFGAYMDPQWETCQATGESCLLDDTDPSNPLALDGTDCQLGNLPSYHINVGSAEDIQAALSFAESTGTRLSVKSHGHDYKGRSSGKNTVGLWLAKLNTIEYNPIFVPDECQEDHPIITIGPGAVLEDIYAFADEHNSTFIGAYHQTVGSGYFLGGGHSVLSPVFGMGVDHVVQLKVVTPDGQFRTANSCQNSDLFWALRGGGGSAFGVVTELSLRVEPRMSLQAAIINFTGNLSAQGDWYQLTVENSLQWGQEGWGGHILGNGLIHVNPRLNNSEANLSMQPAIDFAIAHGGSGFIDDLPSWNAFFTKYVIAVQAPIGPELMLGSRLLPTALFEDAGSRANLSQAIRDALPSLTPYIVVGTPFLYAYVEGSTSVTPAWRNSLWHFSLTGRFLFNSTLEGRASEYAKVSRHIQIFRDMSPGSGAYFNEGDVYEPDHEYSYWGDNYPRLLAVKEKYDPRHLLDCWQCVGWKGANDPLYSCYIKP